MIDAAWLHATQEWLDWEFPACRYDPADWDNYLLLLRTYRAGPHAVRAPTPCTFH